MSMILAIYGAILSTVLATFSLRNYIRGRQYIVIETERSYCEKVEIIDFRIKNLGDRKTRIEGTFIENYVLCKKKKIAGSSGSEFPIFKTTYHKGNKKLSLPFDLIPGETCYIRFNTGDAENFINEERYSFQEEETRLNLFCLEIKHSQGRFAESYFFTMYASKDSVLARSLDATLPSRLGLFSAKIWKLDRGLQ